MEAQMFQQEALVREMGNLRKFALRLTRNPSDAEDLLQATLLRALEKKTYFEDGTNLFSWTSKIMFNLFASQYRHRRKFDTQYDPAAYIEHASVAPSQEATADLAAVRDCMKRLSKDHREILLMVAVKGMRYEDVSEALQIPVGTVRSRLSRAREHLTQLLEPTATATLAPTAPYAPPPPPPSYSATV
jgi:RNA polymerase sigma-70 factor (ECF subfamily)